jgi:hypothetical protein
LRINCRTLADFFPWKLFSLLSSDWVARELANSWPSFTKSIWLTLATVNMTGSVSTPDVASYRSVNEARQMATMGGASKGVFQIKENGMVAVSPGFTFSASSVSISVTL